MTSPPSPRARAHVRWLGLAAGPLLAAAVLALLPPSYLDAAGVERTLAPAGVRTLALLVWMATWWLTEAVDIEATALLPVVALPWAGVSPIAEAARPYASPLVFLFLGGFLLAIGMQRHRLDRRIALLTIRAAGTRPTQLVGGFMVATAVLSSCVSNTATVAMMLPIALGVVRLLAPPSATESGTGSLRTCLLLAIAYAASIGGLATLIGSPPNGFLAQFAADQLGTSITFLRWLAVGLPVVAVLLPLSWWLLTRVLVPVPREPIGGGAERVADAYARLGAVGRGERLVFAVFLLTVLGWMSRPLLARLVPQISDAGIAMTAGLALFLLPVDLHRRRFVLHWDDLAELPWGVLILFGGGLSLAAAVSTHGVGEYLGSLARGLHGAPPLVLVACTTGGMIFLTELTSNTASAATLVPILVALAPGLGLAPLELAVPATLAASCAFMLPVATPPNAIVFGSGYVPLARMIRAGVWMNLVALAVLVAVLQIFGVRALG